MAETTNYLIAGYVVFTIGIAGYLLSLVLRARSLRQDLDVLQEMDAKEK